MNDEQSFFHFTMYIDRNAFVLFIICRNVTSWLKVIHEIRFMISITYCFEIFSLPVVQPSFCFFHVKNHHNHNNQLYMQRWTFEHWSACVLAFEENLLRRLLSKIILRSTHLYLCKFHSVTIVTNLGKNKSGNRGK